jgi:cysteine desulfurase / selenocysteine lyase
MFDLKKVRSDFPILKRKIKDQPLVYLDNAATSQKPIQVIEAISSYYENSNANVHRGVHTLSEEATDLMEKARENIASFIGAGSSKEVIFVRNASEGLNVVMRGWGERFLGKGDEMITTEQEHHSNLVPWQVLADQKGVGLGVVEVDDEGRLKLRGGKVTKIGSNFKLGDLEGLLNDKVKLVTLTQVSNLLGVINQIEKIVKMIREKSPEAVIMLDGSQSVPHMPVDVSSLGVDFFTFSGHKMLGPTGIGVLWGREKILSKMTPVLFGGDMISDVKLTKSQWNELPYKFEAGTPNIAGAVGLGAAVDYLRNLGMDEVKNHEKELLEYGFSRFRELEKEGMLEMYGPKGVEMKGGVLIFNVKGVHAHDVAQVLDSFGIAVRSGFHCAQPLAEKLGMGAAVRASFYLYNTKEEIDFLVDKIPEVLKVFQVKK